jgi:hypothetical protein
LMTLNGRLNGKTGFRAKAGHSVHDMLIAAGLPCACKECSLPRIKRGMNTEPEPKPEMAECPY